MRKLVLWIHLVLGLSLGLVTVLLGLTGSVLVFRDEIDASIYPEFHLSQRGPRSASFAELVSAVEEAIPKARVATIDLPTGPDGIHAFWMKGSDLRGYANPQTGTVVGIFDESKTFTGWLFKVHTQLFAGEAGKTVAGISGYALVLLSLSGLVIWWPRKNQRARDGMVVRRTKNRKRFNFDLHRSTGFWYSGFLLIIGLTGAGLALPDQAKAAVYGLYAEEAPKAPKASKDAAGATIDKIVSAANSAMPDGELARITLPKKDGDPYVVRKRTSNELHPNGMNYIYVDASAKVLKVQRDTGDNMPQKLMNLRYPVHLGLYGGLLTRILHATAGMMPLILAVTGIRMFWWRNVKKRSAAKL